MMPSHHTELLQSCHVGINKSQKMNLKNVVLSRGVRNLWKLLPEKLLNPERSDVLDSLKMWDKFPTENMKNSFRRCAYFYEDGIDYSGSTESESESDIGTE